MDKSVDSINLNGSMTFMTADAADELRKVAKYSYRMRLLVEPIVQDDGLPGWTVEVTKNFVSPYFIDFLHTVSTKHKSTGTLTYIFNQRFEVGVLRNGDLIRLQARELTTFAIEKLGYLEGEIESSQYDRIKEAWFFKLWGLN